MKKSTEIEVTIKFGNVTKENIAKYNARYNWLQHLSENGKAEAYTQIKKFDVLNCAIPVGLIYEQCKLIE